MANKIINTISSFFKKKEEPNINDMVQKKVKEEMNKVNQGEIIRFSPKGLFAMGGSVAKPQYGGDSFSTLRQLADYYPIARSCIEFRKSQITHLEFGITPLEITNETVQDEENVKNAREIKEFFKHPTGKKDASFTDWSKQILEDLLVIDAVALYKRKLRGGKVVGYLPIDGATIERILEPDGTTPDPPADAYIQKIQGKEQARLSSDDLIYAMMTPRTYSAFGFAPLEALIVTVSTALKMQSYNFATLQEGNVPEGFVTLPRDIASSRDQVKEWQDAWDAMLAGDPRFQKKLKFLPEGMKYEPTKKAEDMAFERFEKWLLTCTTSVFGLHPSSIGFNFDVNRATAESAWEVGRERGLFPTALFLKEIFDRIIQEDLGHPELQFVWTNLNPTNKAEEAEVVKNMVNGGLISIDEWRLGEGLKPIGVNDPFILTPVGPIFVKDLKAQSESGQQPIAPYQPGGKPRSGDSKNVPLPAQAKVEYIEELRRWKRVALNDFKEGKKPRAFKSDVLDNEIYGTIASNLIKVKNKEEIFKIFEPYINNKQIISAGLLNLYDQIDKTIEDGQSKETVNSRVEVN